MPRSRLTVSNRICRRRSQLPMTKRAPKHTRGAARNQRREWTSPVKRSGAGVVFDALVRPRRVILRLMPESG